MPEPAKILAEALALPSDDRARLAGSLIESLDDDADASVEDAWRVEVARRVKELDEGSVQAIDWAEARRQILI